MTKITSIALTAALFGFHSAPFAAATGCYPAFGSSGTYIEGSLVSITETEPDTESCTSGSSGCVNGVRAITVTVRNNYECTVAIRCNQAGFEPGSGNEGWTLTGECDPDDPTPDPVIPSAWSGGGCPEAYTSGADYSQGEAVSVNFGTFSLVYTCVENANSAFCGSSGYEPGTGQFTSLAWNLQGSCDGTVTPTNSPIFNVLDDVGGCPEEYVAGGDYEEMDKVSVDGFVFQCRDYPNSGWCGNPAYDPGAEDSNVWTEAWTLLGHCDGTITPTQSPDFASLQNQGGCPQEWMAGGPNGEAYEEGDRISVGELVFQCKGFPASGWCSQAGYIPLDQDASTAGAWADAWTLVGYCDGSMGPTESPSFDPDGSIGGCPDEWVSGGGEDGYVEGDMVSVTISTDPERKVAYRCKAWPLDGHCAQLSPTEFGGDQGWAFAGSCDGSIGPTSSPVFVALSMAGDGACPKEYDSSVDYEAGDQVTVIVAEPPTPGAPFIDPLSRNIVYECKNYPESGYCANQAANLAPGEDFGYLGWTLKGYCNTNMSPTASPTEYEGVPYFIRCNEPSQCTPGTIKAYDEAPGSSSCSCGDGDDSGSHCQRTICNYVEVVGYSSSTTYKAGDVVRIGNLRYKCKGHPFTGWCSIDAYAPMVETNELWPQAWTRDGDAPQSSPGATNGFNNPIGAPCDDDANCDSSSSLTCSSGTCECASGTCCTMDSHCDTDSGDSCGGGGTDFVCGQ